MYVKIIELASLMNNNIFKLGCINIYLNYFHLTYLTSICIYEREREKERERERERESKKDR